MTWSIIGLYFRGNKVVWSSVRYLWVMADLDRYTLWVWPCLTDESFGVRFHVTFLFPRKLNHTENTMKRRKEIFYGMLRRLSYDYVIPGPYWSIIIPTQRDYERICLTLSWKFGNDVKNFSNRTLLYHICRNYKKCDRMDYYFRKYQDHVF